MLQHLQFASSSKKIYNFACNACIVSHFQAYTMMVLVLVALKLFSLLYFFLVASFFFVRRLRPFLSSSSFFFVVFHHFRFQLTLVSFCVRFVVVVVVCDGCKSKRIYFNKRVCTYNHIRMYSRS